MAMLWYRIDNRLIHGQIVEAWLPYLGAGKLVVVNDELASDPMRQQIMLLAVPERVKVIFTSISDLRAGLEKWFTPTDRVLVLFATCADARMAFDSGVIFTVCNIGNLHYSPGKMQLCQHVALSETDESCLRYLENNSVTLDFRCIPADNPQLKNW